MKISYIPFTISYLICIITKIIRAVIKVDKNPQLTFFGCRDDWRKMFHELGN